MKIVDAVEIHVLGVPGKARLPAAKVEVGRVHAADLDPVVLINIKTEDKKTVFIIGNPHLFGIFNLVYIRESRHDPKSSKI
jgi:hypothetical protein